MALKYYVMKLWFQRSTVSTKQVMREGGVKTPQSFFFKKIKHMAVLGSNSKPIMIKGAKKGKILGAWGSNNQNYKNNWDKIWGKKETSNTTSKAV